MLQTQNVNTMFSWMCTQFSEVGADVIEQTTRNGKARSFARPTLVCFLAPRERVLFHPDRHANPVFHLMEALWMLAGRDDVAFVRQFNQQMYVYSDDGVRFNAAYGFRWRKHFEKDQIQVCIDMLKRSPNDRRVVMSMWDPYQDLDSTSLDLPCNIQILFRMLDGALHMTTVNRSNDVIWGLLGANCVHLTILQEFMAYNIGARVGRWYHMSNNLHVYDHHYELVEKVARQRFYFPDYPPPSRLVKDPKQFLLECEALCNGQQDYFEEPFFDGTVAPMIQSWHAWKTGDFEQAKYLASCIDADDWRKGTVEWYDRAVKRRSDDS